MNFTKTRDISAEVFKMIRQIYENQSVSNLEKDLLKEKLRRLYEAIDEISQVNSDEKDSHKTRIDEETELPPANYEVITNHPSELENIEDLEELDLTSIQIPITSIKQKEKSEDSVIKQLEMVDKDPINESIIELASEVKRNHPNANDEIDELFIFTEAKDLLEKLREAPITDISKAFTLNERLLYAKVLFGNNLEQMNHILGKLNHLNSFEDAKNILVDEVIYTYGWNTNDKKKTAKELIQVIKRRYAKV